MLAMVRALWRMVKLFVAIIDTILLIVFAALIVTSLFPNFVPPQLLGFIEAAGRTLATWLHPLKLLVDLVPLWAVYAVGVTFYGYRIARFLLTPPTPPRGAARPASPAAPPAPTPEVKPPRIEVALTGRQNSGKSVLIDATLLTGLSRPMGGVFRLGPRGVASANHLCQVLEAGLKQIRAGGRVTTAFPIARRLHLWAAEREVMELAFLDSVGQHVGLTTPASPAEQLGNLDEHVTRLATADVVWLVIACPPREPAAEDDERFARDVVRTQTIIRQLLAVRTASRPVSLALVLTRIDSAYQTEAQAHAELPRRALGRLIREFSWVATARGVAEAVIVPVAAVGMGVAEPVPAGRAEDGPGYRVKDSGQLRPFNVQALLVWTMLAGLRQRPSAQVPLGAREFDGLCRHLTTALAGTWLVALKDAGRSGQ